MKKYFNLLILTFFALAISSCKKDKYEAEKSNTVNMSGRWWIELYSDDNGNGMPDVDDNIIYTYHDLGEWYLITSNTTDNSSDSLIFSEKYYDTPAKSMFPWLVKAKLPINYTYMTFKPSTVKNLVNFNTTDSVYETITVNEGKIIKNAATLLSGRKGDSIFISLEFSDDPGINYLITGHRDSGQPEDQH